MAAMAKKKRDALISLVTLSLLLACETHAHNATRLLAAAPTQAPSAMNFAGIMTGHGCKVFAETLLANPGASKTYQDSVEGGVTVFCPKDEAMKGFMATYKNLTAPNKESFLEFLAVPTYYSMSMLRSNNGPMNTLATDGSNTFALTVQNDGEGVTLKTKADTVKILDTLVDKDPLAIYATDKVLLPNELFKPAETPAPAPAPKEEAADSPEAPSKGKKKKKKAGPSADSPAGSPDDGNPADQKADDATGAKVGLVTSLVCLCASWLL